jgi:hypothetical protein
VHLQGEQTLLPTQRARSSCLKPVRPDRETVQELSIRARVGPARPNFRSLSHPSQTHCRRGSLPLKGNVEARSSTVSKSAGTRPRPRGFVRPSAPRHAECSCTSAQCAPCRIRWGFSLPEVTAVLRLGSRAHFKVAPHGGAPVGATYAVSDQSVCCVCPATTPRWQPLACDSAMTQRL